MHDGDRRSLTVLMTADAVGGIWHYALALCAALPEIRFVLAVMGPMPSAAQRDAAGRVDNVVLEEYGHRLEWMQGAAGNLDSSRHWLTLLARRYRADLLHVNGYAHARNETGLPTLAVAHSDVLSWWHAVHREAAPRRVGAVSARGYGRAARRRPGRGAYRRRARRSGAPLRVRPRLRHRDPERHRYRLLCAAAKARRDHGGRQTVGRGEKPRAARRSRRRLSIGRSRSPARRTIPRGVRPVCGRRARSAC